MSSPMLANPVVCALDRPDLDGALTLARELRGIVGGLKLGLEFVMAQGPGGVRAVTGVGLPVFLDVKLHDIPNTVAGAMRALAGLGVQIINVHAAGGPAMMQAAREAAGSAADRPRVIAVTVLTSLDAADLEATGVPATPVNQAVRLALMTKECGLDGVVCSPLEIRAIREACGTDVQLVVPGIRPVAAGDDQKRTTTPADALKLGADLLVIGRPITAAASPRDAAAAIVASLDRAGP
jgi:orotidine-5'-phosphate decarboxylase